MDNCFRSLKKKKKICDENANLNGVKRDCGKTETVDSFASLANT